MGVKINDINLLKFCEISIFGSQATDFNDEFPSDKYVCFGSYGNDGKPLWSVVLHGFKERHECVIDFALSSKGMFSPNLFKKIARVIANYGFVQANLVRGTICIRESNKASIRLAKAWGFKEEGIKRLGYRNPDEDMHMLGILKTECKWI